MQAHSESARIPERFELERELGAGAMGRVYLAYDRQRHAHVALKTLRERDGGSLLLLKREFRSLAGVVHPNLVTLYELASDADTWYVTMEYVDGVDFLEHVRPYRAHLHELEQCSTDALPACGFASTAEPSSPSTLTQTADPFSTQATMTLASGAADAPLREPSELRRRAILESPLDAERLREAFLQLVRGVAALHAAGKLHHDLKHSNVLVDKKGRVVVCDFGLVAETELGDDTGGPHAILGTPFFMSPERANGHRADTASDWYSAGVMLFEALTGQLPFAGSPSIALRAKTEHEAPDPDTLVANLPADLAALARDLLRRDPSARPTAAEIVRRLGHGRRTSLAPKPVPAPPFVGRERELALLETALADSRKLDHTVTVLLSGRSGFGKSALVREFLTEVQARESCVVLRSRCHQRESVPYKSLDALVDTLAARLLQASPSERAKLLPRGAAELARLFPVMRQLVDDGALAKARVGDAQEARRRAFSALRAAIEALARTSPTIVYVDDLQWGDLDSVSFFSELAHDTSSSGVLFIASFRAEEEHESPVLEALLSDFSPELGSADIRRIDLGPLDVRETRDLLHCSLGESGTLSVDSIERLHAESGGSPLFIAELSRARLQAGAGADVGVRSLDDLLGGRIAALPKEARLLLDSLSVAARPMPLDVLCTAAQITDEPFAMAALEAQRFVRTASDGTSERIEPYHDRVREVAVKLLDEASVRSCHQKLALALETVPEPDPLVLVEHWLSAGAPKRAGSYAAAAARIAEEALAFDRAVHYRRLVLELCELEPDARRGALVALGEALANAGALGEAANTFLEAAQGAEVSTALALRCRASEQLIRYGAIKDGVELAKRVLSEVGIGFPVRRGPLIARILLWRLWLKLRGFGLRKRSGEVDPALLRKIDVCQSLAGGMAFSMPVHGTFFQTRQLLWALAAGDPDRASFALNLEVPFRALTGTPEAPTVKRLEGLALELARAIDSPGAVGFSIGASGVARFLLCEFQEGYDRCIEGARLMREHPRAGFLWQASFVDIFRMAATYYLGRIGELSTVVPTMLREALAHGDEYLARSMRAWRTNVAWLVMDDPAEAERQLDAGELGLDVGGFTVQHYYSLYSRCQLDLYRGDGEAAWRRVETRWGEARKSMIFRIQTLRIEGPLVVARCALAAASARPLAQRQPMHEAALRCAAEMAREDTAWSKAAVPYVHGLVAWSEGQRERAEACLTRALDGFRSAHMELFARVTELRLGELRGGEAGAQLARSARAWMEAERIRDPQRFAWMLAPIPS